MLQSSGAVSAVKNASAVTIKRKKRKASVTPPFMWVKFPGMELYFAELLRENADRLRTHTSDTTPLYADMRLRLEARFKTNALQGPEGIARLRQKYKNLRKKINTYVIHQSTPGNERYALPHVYVSAK